MSFLNFNFGLLVAEDFSNTDPNVRDMDIKRSYQALTVSNDESKSVILAPGETREIIATTRSLSIEATSGFQFFYPVDGEYIVRMKWSGVGSNPIFRTKRNLAIDATTIISITRVSPNSIRIASVGGTPLNSGAVQVGDILRFERNIDTFTNPFSTTNAGQSFVVQAIGSGYIDVIDNGIASLDSNITLGASFDMALRVISVGPVRVGDKVSIDGTTVNQSNKGEFTITDVSGDYIEFTNSFAVAETIVNTSNLITVYDRLIGFVNIRASNAVKIRINNNGILKVRMLDGVDAILIGSVDAWRIEAINELSESVVVSLKTVSLG